jgi:hypothetical protein
MMTVRAFIAEYLQNGGEISNIELRSMKILLKKSSTEIIRKMNRKFLIF